MIKFRIKVDFGSHGLVSILDIIQYMMANIFTYNILIFRQVLLSNCRKYTQLNAGPGSVLRPGAISLCPTMRSAVIFG